MTEIYDADEDCYDELKSLMYDTLSDDPYYKQSRKTRKDLTTVLENALAQVRDGSMAATTVRPTGQTRPVLAAAFTEANSSNAKGMTQPGYGSKIQSTDVTDNSNVPKSSLESMEENCFYVQLIAAEKKSKGKGYGTKLMSDAKRRAFDLGQSLILGTSSRDSCAFYHKMDMIHIATHKSADGTQRYDVFGIPAAGVTVNSRAVSTTRDCTLCQV